MSPLPRFFPVVQDCRYACLSKKGGLMNSIRTDFTEPKGSMVNRNGWESTLGRLDAIEDQINRALHRSTSIEEPKRDVRIVQSQKIIEHGKIRRHFLLIERRGPRQDRLSVLSQI
jgi:hypothetical protein